MTNEETEVDEKTLELLQHMRAAADESDRGEVIFVTAQIDLYLRRVLESFLIDDKSVEDLFDTPFAPFSTLSGKTKVAYLMGLISKTEAQRIDAVRKVRNVFAHDLGASFDHEDVKKLCSKPPIFDGRLCDRDAFFHMALNVIPRLMYRDIRVRKELKRVALTNEQARDHDAVWPKR
jgi:hypothetical protein